jgi:hypothetical protein
LVFFIVEQECPKKSQRQNEKPTRKLVGWMKKEKEGRRGGF